MQKKTYILSITLLLTFVMLIFIFSISKSKNNMLHMNSDTNVSIERIDLSINSNDETVLAIIYYDKPVISSSSDSASTINAYFDKEYQGWLEGSNRLTQFQDGRMDFFIRNVKDMREGLGDDVLKKQPLIYTVDTEVAFISQDILSIRQIVFLAAGGPNSWYYFGSTFNLETGELLPFDHVIDVDSDVFRENLVAYLAKNTLAFDHNSSLKEIQQIYEPNEDHNYEYYYDGEYIYLILNYGIFHNCGCIMKWNGKVGDAFDASLLGYIRQVDGSIKMIEY